MKRTVTSGASGSSPSRQERKERRVDALWIDAARETVASYRRMIDATISQLTDEEFRSRPAEGVNSVAIILRHLGGNLRSRWTDFLDTDGETPDRDRESEVSACPGDRHSLIEYFDTGWSALVHALESLDDSAIGRTIFIRGEPQSAPQAILRSISHVAYHVGQIAMVSRMVHDGEWRWQTIAPGKSADFNSRTWGSSASRGVLGGEEEKG
jgi:uncharacterized damage-inducible protein DinB